ncbi:MAG: HD domain-containing protein [Yoonia sp.]|uniref:HD domain-containing protein n=1 Tax=Yoonia sp. TaxID=2212373 RepID=UPI003EF0B3B3
MIDIARIYAQAAHRAVGQRRKYTGECYTVHTVDVARLVQEFGGTDDMIAAAHLHDVVEDTQVTLDDIGDVFGAQITELVTWLTDISKPEDGNRATRKAMDRDHLAQAPADAQTIKCCDLISNTASIVAGDPKFAKVYLAEKLDLLTVMTKADPAARNAALSLVSMDVE